MKRSARDVGAALANSFQKSGLRVGQPFWY